MGGTLIFSTYVGFSLSEEMVIFADSTLFSIFFFTQLTCRIQVTCVYSQARKYHSMDLDKLASQKQDDLNLHHCSNRIYKCLAWSNLTLKAPPIICNRRQFQILPLFQK